MKTSQDLRVKRVVFGMGLMAVGTVFVMPLSFASYIIGLLLVGFGIDPRGTEYPEDDLPPAAVAKPRPEPKRSARKKKAS